MTHEVMVDYRTICGDKIIIPAGNVNEDVIAATFSDEWTENLTKAVIFERGGRVFQTTLADGIFAIPAKLAATAGRFRWGFVGYEIDGDTVTERISTAPVYGMITDGAYDDGAPDDVEPAEWEALIAHLTDFKNPHRVTADQIGAATTEALNEVVLTLNDLGLGLYNVIGDVRDLNGSVDALETKTDQMNGALAMTEETAAEAKTAATAARTEIEAHKNDKNNPHKVTAEQVGAFSATGGDIWGDTHVVGKISADNGIDTIGDINVYDHKILGVATPTNATDGANKAYVDGQIDEISAKLSGVVVELHETAEELDAHKANKENPHEVTAEQIGAIPASEKGAANGVAGLGAEGYVPNAQLPTYVSAVSFSVQNGTTLVLRATSSR